MQPFYTLHRQAWIDSLVWVCFLFAFGTLVYTEASGATAIWPRWVAMMLLSWWLPGFLIVRRWQPPALNGPLAILLLLGLGWCWQVALLIVLHWIPGPLSYPLFLGGYSIGVLGLLLLSRGRPFCIQSTSLHSIWWLLILFLIALALRLPGLGFHEFHQDETHLLRRANEAITGTDDALARHTKGIGEIAVVIVVYRALGTVTEGTARLPFALASVASIVGLGVLGKRLWGTDRIGFAAGLLLAMNGFALGLSRIAQYQGSVLLLSVLAFLTMWEFYRTRSPVWLTYGALVSAFGVVMHYEFLLNFLPLSMLLIAGLRRIDWREQAKRRSLLVALGLSGLSGVIIVTVAYLPLLFNPYFSTTVGYLNSRVAEGRANNLVYFLQIGTFYNSVYFAFGLLLLVISGISLGLRRPALRRRMLLLVAWFLPAGVLYLFVVQHPGTHFYMFMPSWSLLAAPPLAGLTFTGGSLPRPIRHLARWTLRSAVCVWLGLSIGYLFLLFFRQSPAYLVNYPETSLAFYVAPHGQQLPPRPRFGFPVAQGWKALGILGEWNYLPERFASNERSDLLHWYLRSNDHVPLTDKPDVVFVAHYVQELELQFDFELLYATYQQIGEVRVNGKPQISIWAQRLPATGYLVYEAEHFTQAFDEDVPALRNRLASPMLESHLALDERLRLMGTAYNRRRLAAGDLLHLVFWWQVVQPFELDYKLFVHVTDETGIPLAQWDGWPGQNTQQTTAWQVGTEQEDHVLLLLPADLPADRYTIRVGFYDPVTGARLGAQALEIMSIDVHD